MDDMQLSFLVIGILAAAWWGFGFFRSRRVRSIARAWLAEGASLVDVRSRQEFASGHHPGAVNIPLDSLGGRLKSLGDRSRPVVVYCASGSRAGAAVVELKTAGFQRVLNARTQANLPS